MITRQPYYKSLSNTGGWKVIEDNTTISRLLHVKITASGGAIKLRRKSASTTEITIDEGQSIEHIGIDLSTIEVNVESASETCIVAGSPY